MAITHKFPVFVMEDHSGLFTACFLEHREETSAVGKNADEALRQLKEYMQWGYREKSWVWREGSDFLEPSVRDIKVLIRPSYEDRDRVYPCQETVMLRLPCVHGREGSGMFVAFMPTIDIRFNYYDRGALKNLAAHYAKKRLQGLPPFSYPDTCRRNRDRSKKFR